MGGSSARRAWASGEVRGYSVLPGRTLHAAPPGRGLVGAVRHGPSPENVEIRPIASASRLGSRFLLLLPRIRLKSIGTSCCLFYYYSKRGRCDNQFQFDSIWFCFSYWPNVELRLTASGACTHRQACAFAVTHKTHTAILAVQLARDLCKPSGLLPMRCRLHEH